MYDRDFFYIGCLVMLLATLLFVWFVMQIEGVSFSELFDYLYRSLTN